jgi:hypothetical protein
MSPVQPDLDQTLSHRFAAPAEDARATQTVATLPAGSQVHQGASQSLEASGVAEEIANSGRYEPVVLCDEALGF